MDILADSNCISAGHAILSVIPAAHLARRQHVYCSRLRVSTPSLSSCSLIALLAFFIALCTLRIRNWLGSLPCFGQRIIQLGFRRRLWLQPWRDWLGFYGTVRCFCIRWTALILFQFHRRCNHQHLLLSLDWAILEPDHSKARRRSASRAANATCNGWRLRLADLPL
jgi:hypothetical protein